MQNNYKFMVFADLLVHTQWIGAPTPFGICSIGDKVSNLQYAFLPSEDNDAAKRLIREYLDEMENGIIFGDETPGVLGYLMIVEEGVEIDLNQESVVMAYYHQQS